MDTPPLGGQRESERVHSVAGMGNTRTPLIGTHYVIHGEGSIYDKFTFQIDDVASGVEYLHSRDPPICHGDLKSVKPRTRHLDQTHKPFAEYS